MEKEEIACILENIMGFLDNDNLDIFYKNKKTGKIKAYMPIIIFTAGLLVFSSVASYQFIFKGRTTRSAKVEPEISQSLTDPLESATGDEETSIPGISSTPTPTIKLSPTPTRVPTKAPTATKKPTSSPTPSPNPTATSTATPTSEPTATPTNEPTLTLTPTPTIPAGTETPPQ